MDSVKAGIVALMLTAGCASNRRPDIYFSFDEAPSVEQLTNCGRHATGEKPFRVGSAEGPTATLSAGISGRALDGGRFISKQPANVPVWGTDRAGLPDTGIEKLFEGARSVTVTAWIKTDSLQPQGRLMKTPAFQINYRGDRLETGFAKPKKWFSSDISSDLFGSVEQWRFVAMIWVSTAKGGIIHYYSGTENSPVVPAGSVETDCSVLRGNKTGCWLTIGNSEADGNRPFVGLIDEVKIWISQDSAVGVLTPGELEAVRCSRF